MATINEKMTAIADAIRAKTGESSDVKYGLDAMAAAIAALETGGGLPEGVSALSAGSFALSTSSAATNVKEITHGLGVKPNFYLASTTVKHLTGTSETFIILGIDKTTTSSTYQAVRGYAYFTSSGGVSGSFTRSTTSYFDEEKFSMETSSSYPIKRTSWRWICGVMDNIN